MPAKCGNTLGFPNWSETAVFYVIIATGWWSFQLHHLHYSLHRPYSAIAQWIVINILNFHRIHNVKQPSGSVVSDCNTWFFCLLLSSVIWVFRSEISWLSLVFYVLLEDPDANVIIALALLSALLQLGFFESHDLRYIADQRCVQLLRQPGRRLETERTSAQAPGFRRRCSSQ